MFCFFKFTATHNLRNGIERLSALGRLGITVSHQCGCFLVQTLPASACHLSQGHPRIFSNFYPGTGSHNSFLLISLDYSDKIPYMGRLINYKIKVLADPTPDEDLFVTSYDLRRHQTESEEARGCSKCSSKSPATTRTCSTMSFIGGNAMDWAPHVEWAPWTI